MGEEVLNQVQKLNNKFLNKTLIAGGLVEILIVMPTQEAITILKELLVNPNSAVKHVMAQNLQEIIKLTPSLAQEAFIFLKVVITNSSNKYEVKAGAIESMVEIIGSIPSLVQEAFTFLKVIIININPDTDYDIKPKAVEGIAAVVKMNPNLAQESFAFLKEVITNSKIDPYTKSIATQNISKIVIVMPSLLQKSFTFLEELFTNHKTNSSIKFEATRSIAEIAKVMPTQEAFTFLKIVLINPKTKVTESIIEIVRKMPSVAQEAFVFLKLVITNPDTGSNTRSELTRNIALVVGGMPSLAQQVFTFLREIITTYNTYNVEYDATKSIAAIVKIKSNLTQKALALLKERIIEPKGGINYAAAISLINIINVRSFGKASYKPINELLTIIDLTKTKDHYKELYLDAQTTLHKITAHITQEYEKSKNPEVIEWFNKCFNELPNISETRIFLKEICQSILKSGVINEYESKFILNCIKKYNFTFTVSVSKEPEIEGKIIFEDRNYKIFKTDNSASKIVSLEEFATKLLAETDDPLAEQYKTHTPLFSNKGVGLKIAASDINYVSSITNENTKLSTERYLLSYAGDNKDKFVMLLEKRSIFGDHLIYKFSEDNLKKIATIYPAEISKELRGQLFNELESKEQFNCFIKNEKLKSEEEKRIFKCPNKLKFATEIIQDAKIRLETSNFKLLDAGANKRLDAHEIKVDSHNKTLKDSGTIQKAEIFREIEKLKQENILFYNYYYTFYCTTRNIILDFQIAEAKMFKNNNIEEEAIIKLFTKSLDLTIKSLLKGVCSILAARRKRKEENRVISINDIIRNTIGMEDLDDNLKKIAISKTQERKNEIINPQKMQEIHISNSYSRKFRAYVQKTFNKVKELVSPKAIERHDMDNLAVQLALKDSILFIESLYTNHDDILNKKNDFYVQDEKDENSNIV
ncbi:hypothetical protein RHORCCE3_1296 [Rickettsia hoogstraalii str. RCCE3]|nr:hypothetical protein RHORCCE3_1296 [Rickettsia hoogstraalii str. RCCE3]